jgi:hypothetical protein
MRADCEITARRALGALGGVVLLAAAAPSWGQERMITSAEVRCAIRSWYEPTRGHHFYAPAGDGNPPGWTAEQVRFVTFARKSSSQMVPLYRMFRPGGGHFYTTNADERNRLISQGGFTNENHIGYVYPQAYSDLVALHRWYKPRLDRHFYSTDRAEGDRAGFTYEGVIGYVRPAATAGQAELNCATQRSLDGPAQAASPAPTPPPAPTPAVTAGLVLGLKLDLAQLVSSLNNTSALTTVAPLADVTPLANANPLNNTSAFTMPMGNNLSGGRGVQSMISGSVGVLHLAGAARAEALQCVEWTGTAFQLTAAGACAREPRRSVFAFTSEGMIHWIEPTTSQPSRVCLSAFADRSVGSAACESASRWVLNPKDPQALSPAGVEGLALAGRPHPSPAARGVFLLALQPLQAAGSNWRWSLLAVPRAQ